VVLGDISVEATKVLGSRKGQEVEPLLLLELARYARTQICLRTKTTKKACPKVSIVVG
jgi:hypothetical protein